MSLSCQAHSSFCDDNEKVLFKLPDKLTASYMGNGSMLVEWVNTDMGWVSQYINVELKVNFCDNVYHNTYLSHTNMVLYDIRLYVSK